MSMKRCIPELQGQNKLSRDQAETGTVALRRPRAGLFHQVRQASRRRNGERGSGRRLRSRSANKKRQAALQVTAQQTIAADVRRFSKDNPGAAAEALLASDDRAPYFNVEFRSKAIANEHFAMMNGILDKHSRNVVGQVRDVATLHDVVREAFGENSGNAAARTGRRMARYGGKPETALQRGRRCDRQARQVGNAAGSQHARGACVSFEEWRDFIRPLLDPQRMLDETGNPDDAGADGARAARRLRDHCIGWLERPQGRSLRGGKLGNRHQDSRFLIFKDADSWLSYAQKFGRPLSKHLRQHRPGRRGIRRDDLPRSRHEPGHCADAAAWP
jgi:hypothetical protein